MICYDLLSLAYDKKKLNQNIKKLNALRVLVSTNIASKGSIMSICVYHHRIYYII